MPRRKKADTQPNTIDMTHATTLPIVVQPPKTRNNASIQDDEISVQVDNQDGPELAEGSTKVNEPDPEPIGINETIVDKKDDSEESKQEDDSSESKQEDSEPESEDDSSEPKDDDKRFTGEQMNAIIARKIKESQDEVAQLKKQNEELTKQVEAAKKEGIAAGQIDALREQTAEKFGIKKNLIPTTKEDIEEFNKQLDRFTSNHLRVLPAKTKQKKEEDDNGPIQGVIAGGTFLQ